MLYRAAAQLLARTGAQGWIDLLFVPLVTVGLATYFAASNQYFLTSLNITNILVQASTLAIVSLGVTFVILAGELDLSVGSAVSLVSVAGSLVMHDTGSIALGVLAGLAVGIAIGLFNGLVVTRFEVPSFIATFGMLVMASGIALALTNGGVVAGLPIAIGNLAINGWLGIRWIIWLTLGVFAILYFLQTQTAFGVRVFAVGGDRQAAELAGINVRRVRLLVFLISGLCAGVAAMLLTARLESGQPHAGDGLELQAIAAVVIGGTSIFGGRGSLVRTLVGVLLIAILYNGLDLEGVGDDKKRILIGLVLIAAASVDFIRRSVSRRRQSKEAALIAAHGGSDEIPARSAQ